MKVILNKCYGGFGLSDAAYQAYAKKRGLQLFTYDINCNKVSSKDNFWVTYFTKDFGEHVDRTNKDVYKYILRLNEDYRTDPILIEVIETLGEVANGFCSKLKIVDIPDGMEYVIDEYDGVETLHQKVREW